MLKKLMSGELSLKDTFWKFGLLGLFLIVMAVRFLGGLLAQKLQGLTLWYYYSKYFHPLNMNTGIVVLTVCYLTCLAAFIWYSFVILSGIWRSSAEYDKSLWLRHLSRILMLVLVIVCYNIVF